MNGSGIWHAEQAWLGRPASGVLIEVEAGRISSVAENVPPPAAAQLLAGWTIPGLANVHSHAFQRRLRGATESGGGDFWEWRKQMYAAAQGWDRASYSAFARSVFREMLEAGITAVGEFHYLHQLGNELGLALADAAKAEGIRLTLIDSCYLRGGLDGRPLEGVQQTFSDGDVEHWTARMEELEKKVKDEPGLRIGAAIHSVRAVDPASMRAVANHARERKLPLHIHLAEQPAEVEQCVAVEKCTPTELLEREGVLGADLTAVHSIHIDAADVERLGRSGVTVCACPTTERELGDRVGPLRALADAGCPLSVGSDSNAVIDMLEEGRGLELDQRRATGRRVLHQPSDLLVAATTSGMRALGWDSGELKRGMLADFVTVAAEGNFDPGHLMFARSGRDVVNVVVGGRTVVSR